MLKFDKDVLLKKILPLLRVATTKGLPIYEFLQFALPHDNTAIVHVTATDGKTFLTVKVPTLENPTGDTFTCISSRLLVDLLKTLPTGEVTMDNKDCEQNIKICWPSGKSSLYVAHYGDFPNVNKVAGDKMLMTFNQKKLCNAILKAIPATADEDYGRPALASLYFDCKDNLFNVVASDSHRLVLTSYPMEVSEGNFLLPEKAAIVLKGILTHDEDVEILADEGHVLFRTKDYELVSNLVVAKFPKYKDIIPKDCPSRMVIEKDLLTGILRRMNVFCNKAISVVRLVFTEHSLTVESQDLAIGAAGRESIVTDYSGPDVTMNIKVPLMLETLSSIDSPKVDVGVTETLRPLVIRPASEYLEDEPVVALLMPIR